MSTAALVAGGPVFAMAAGSIKGKIDPNNQPCNCIGKQWVEGKLQPACPCAIRNSHGKWPDGDA